MLHAEFSRLKKMRSHSDYSDSSSQYVKSGFLQSEGPGSLTTLPLILCPPPLSISDSLFSSTATVYLYAPIRNRFPTPSKGSLLSTAGFITPSNLIRATHSKQMAIGNFEGFNGPSQLPEAISRELYDSIAFRLWSFLFSPLEFTPTIIIQNILTV